VPLLLFLSASIGPHFFFSAGFSLLAFLQILDLFGSRTPLFWSQLIRGSHL
jgi:hypothetical protein